VELKENIKRQWWKAMVQQRDDVVALEGAVEVHDPQAAHAQAALPVQLPEVDVGIDDRHLMTSCPWASRQ
jgi:hypothetical protein